MLPTLNRNLVQLMPLMMMQSLRFALVKYGGGVIQMSGSIAGNTYARNRYGNYARARTKPTNPNTANQQNARDAVAFLANRWAQTLTSAQRTAWNLYGSSVVMKNKLGEDIYLSGYNHYIRSNQIAMMGTHVVIDAGPVVFELPDHDPTFAVTCSEATQQLTVTFDATMAWAVEAGGYLYLFQGKPQNAQRSFFAGPHRYYNAIAGIDPGGPVTPDVSVGPFAIAEGQHQWVYGRILRADGRLSEPFRDDTFCAA